MRVERKFDEMNNLIFYLFYYVYYVYAVISIGEAQASGRTYILSNSDTAHTLSYLVEIAMHADYAPNIRL